MASPQLVADWEGEQAVQVDVDDRSVDWTIGKELHALVDMSDVTSDVASAVVDKIADLISDQDIVLESVLARSLVITCQWYSALSRSHPSLFGRAI